MQTYIYDKYGYLVDDEFAKEFIYQNWKFKLEANQKSEKELEELNDFIKRVDQTLFNKGSSIILNRENQFSSISEYGQLSLVGVNIFDVNINDFIKMNTRYARLEKNENNPLISSIRYLWISKTDNIENKVLPNLKKDNFLYQKVYSLIVYSLGLAENAISYLQDISIDYGDMIEEVALSHKRINEISSYELLNPFNLILDSPMRDVADLIKLGAIDKSNLESVLSNYNMNAKNASLLLARIIYPSYLFDLLEEHFITKKDIKKDVIKYYNQISKGKERLQFIHSYLVNRYGIRPINWLLLK
jgi:hypothetical protein